ncbi:MAG: TolC family protein, partial [Magnetococcales bacterium]|nr:TolC family protein [Magnetococcales bacterium]
PQINRIGYRNQSSKTVFDSNVETSTATTRKDTSMNVDSQSLTIGQQLPWGPTLTLSTTVQQDERYYHEEKYSYDAPFATSMTGSIWLPMPFSRYFGPDAPVEISIQQAKLNKKKTDYQLTSLINATLAQVDIAYWNQVKALETLRAAINNRKTVEEQVAQNTRLFDIGRATRYGKQQLEAELARTKVVEESARAGLLTASNTLAALIENNREKMRSVLYLPVGFHARMQDLHVPNYDASVADALANHPDLNLADVEIESRELALRQSDNNRRPDLSLSASLTHSQDSSTFGYKTLHESLANLDDPDTRSSSTTLSYNYPWKNRALKNAHERSRLSLEDGKLAQRSRSRDIVRDVANAVSGLHAAQASLKQAKLTHELTTTALEKLKRRAKVRGDVPQLEVVLKTRDRMQASINQINALVSGKQAETRLFSAQGAISSWLMNETAINAFDRHRIRTLKKNRALPHLIDDIGEDEVVSAPKTGRAISNKIGVDPYAPSENSTDPNQWPTPIRVSGIPQ